MKIAAGVRNLDAGDHPPHHIGYIAETNNVGTIITKYSM
jgi:hypothetical protein